MEDNNIAELEIVNTATGASIIHIDEAINEEFNVDYEASQNINSAHLDKAVVINLVAKFSPKTQGARTLRAILTYAEGEAVKSEVLETKAIQVSLSIGLATPSTLPEKLSLNSDQAVEFLIKNESGLDATQIKLNVELLDGVTIVKEIPDGNGGYITEGSEIQLDEFNAQANNSLDFEHRFRIKGKVKTDETGKKTLSVLVRYDELKTLADNDSDKAGKKFESNIEIVGVPIEVQIIKPLPKKIKLGQTAELGFKFTNKSDQFAATNVQIEITQGDTNEQKKKLQ
jgi:hypothetical protein